MSFTVQFGWWLIPALMTIATVAWGFLPANSRSAPYGDWAGVVQWMAAIIACLVAWLVWSLLA